MPRRKRLPAAEMGLLRQEWAVNNPTEQGTEMKVLRMGIDGACCRRARHCEDSVLSRAVFRRCFLTQMSLKKGYTSGPAV